MLTDVEDDLLRLTVEFDRVDARRQLSRRAGIRSLAPLGLLRHPHQSAVALDEGRCAAVMRRLREQHLDGLTAWVEVAVGGEGTGR